MNIQIKRIYDAPDASDGFRVLVDRIWLRKWFGHDPERYEEFRKRYRKELEDNPETEQFITLVRQHIDEGPVTLLFGAKDREYNQAVVLREFLEEKI